MFRNILVPLDGSHLAQTILSRIRGIAAPDAVLTMVGVIEGDADTHVPLDAGRSASLVNYLSSLQSRLLDVGLRSDIDIRTGKPDQVILEVSEESDFDLIALATHGHQGVRRLMHKSVTEAIIRNAHAPVLAVKPARADDSPADLISPLSPARPIHRILALVDGSPESDCAAMTSAQLAKDVGATLHLLKVAPLGGRGVLRHADTPDNEDGDLSYVELLAASTRALGVETRAAIASAQGVGGMDAYIIQQKIDLVALATTTNPGVQRWMLAGVAEHLMRDDGVPVLLTCASHPGSATSLRQPPA